MAATSGHPDLSDWPDLSASTAVVGGKRVSGKAGTGMVSTGAGRPMVANLASIASWNGNVGNAGVKNGSAQSVPAAPTSDVRTKGNVHVVEYTIYSGVIFEGCIFREF